jgi:hypothetical protein
MNLIKTLLLIFPLTIFCQTNEHIVDKVANEICIELNEVENFDELTKSQAQEIMAKVFLSNKTEWNNELDKIEKSRNNGYNIFDNLLNHRLQLTCEKFKIVDNLIDDYLKSKPNKRDLYLKVKEFILSAEIETNSNNLLSYFDKSKRETNLKTELKSLQTELFKYKKDSGLYIMWSEYENNGSIFIVNVFDYKTGNENVFIKIYFENENDSFIDGIVFKNKAEMELESKKREEQSIEFIPPPPPAPKKNN